MRGEIRKETSHYEGWRKKLQQGERSFSKEKETKS